MTRSRRHQHFCLPSVNTGGSILFRSCIDNIFTSHLCLSLSTCLPLSLSASLSVFLSLFLSLFVYLTICLSLPLSIFEIFSRMLTIFLYFFFLILSLSLLSSPSISITPCLLFSPLPLSQYLSISFYVPLPSSLIILLLSSLPLSSFSLCILTQSWPLSLTLFLSPSLFLNYEIMTEEITALDF